MASTASTWSPTSLQLRLALTCGNCKKFPLMLVGSRPGKLDRRFRVFCVDQQRARNGFELKRNGSNGVSWVGSDSNVDNFSGWSNSDGEEQSLDSHRSNWFGGVVGAGVAGLVLFTGITFAALSFGKQNDLSPKQQTEPLSMQQEVLLSSDDHDDRGTENVIVGNEVKQESGNLDGQIGNYGDYLPVESNDIPLENKIGISSDSGIFPAKETESAFNASSAKNPPVQEDIQRESSFGDNNVVSDVGLSSLNLPDSGIVSELVTTSEIKDFGGNHSEEKLEPTSELKENLIKVQLESLTDNDADSPGLNTYPLDEISGSTSLPTNFSSSSVADMPSDAIRMDLSASSQSSTISIPEHLPVDNLEVKENIDRSKMTYNSAETNESFLKSHSSPVTEPSATSISASANPFTSEENRYSHNENDSSAPELINPGISYSASGVPAPSVVSAALQVLPGKVLVPAAIDQIQGQALSALQALKVIESNVQPGDLCTRREYARWLVSSSNALSRNSISKVYPAMYIENVTELAFDDITPEDPDFSSIQGLAEAGLIASRLSRHDMQSTVNDKSPFKFSPESPLSRQDLVSWKMTLERRQLPEADRKMLYQLSGFIDIDKIHPDACPALVADISAREQGIIAVAFGYTRLFQPDKPVTKAQAAIALATGEGSDLVSEELARIEAESVAENAVAAHSALVAQVEEDMNASFERELSIEREKISAVERMAEEARCELERLRAEREEDKIALMKEHAAVESEMEVLSRLKHDLEDQLQTLMNNKAEISYEKERINRLREQAEIENKEITHLQYELEVERKALSMARAWAEDEAKRAREQAKALEEARDRWERHGIKVVVDDDLREEASAGVTWLNAGKEFSIQGTVDRAETVMDKLKRMTADIRGKSREVIDRIIQKIALLISNVKEWACKVGKQANELKDSAMSKAGNSMHELQRSTLECSSAVKEGMKRVAGDCREGVEKLTQKFKT